MQSYLKMKTKNLWYFLRVLMLPGNCKQELKLGLSAFLLFTKIFLLNSQDFQPTDAISMYVCCFVSCKTIMG